MNRLQKAKAENPAWRDAFKASSIRVGFGIYLSRAMCEFLSAAADGVQWDRTAFGWRAGSPDNFLATAAALVKRGLIEDDPDYVPCDKRGTDDFYEYTHWRPTAAGTHLVGLLKLAGMFVESDAAMTKKARKKAGK